MPGLMFMRLRILLARCLRVAGVTLAISSVAIGVEKTCAAGPAYNASPATLAPGEAELLELSVPLQTDHETFFAPVLADIETALAGPADVASMTRRVLDGESHHLLLFIEAGEDRAAAEHPAVSAMRAVAGNHRLGLEYQSTRLNDGTMLFGFIVFEPSPTLEMAWESHPYESVASQNGVWLRPFADLADVESVQIAGDRATLVLSPGAARRIDTLSEVHGHRSYRARGAGMAGAPDLGAYTWVPGLRTVPGVPASFTGQIPGQGDVPFTLEALWKRCKAHAAARTQLLGEMELPDHVSWTLPMAAPHYVEPFYCWVVHAPEAGGKVTQAPWYQADTAAQRRWMHVLAPDTPGAAAPIPAHWDFSRTETGPAFSPRPAEDTGARASETAFAAFLRQNLGRDIAVVMQGQVAGLVSISVANPGTLVLDNVSAPAADAMERVWKAANSGIAIDVGPAPPATAPLAKAAAKLPPDIFQVRLMAEPQDRELIPVTHFSAPGAARGTLVAVQNGIILDGRAVTGAYLENKDDRLYLRLTFTPEAQEALGGACFGNMGKQLAIVYKDRLLCAPTIDEWEIEDLSFKGMDGDWPEVARDLARYLGEGR